MPSRRPGQPACLRVLVIDDDRDLADSVCMVLQIMGHEARACYHGVDAIMDCQAFRPQVVLLDLAMSHMDGFQVAKRLRAVEQLAGLVIVALTGFADQDHRDRARQHFDYYLVKPASPADLEEVLDLVVERLAEKQTGR